MDAQQFGEYTRGITALEGNRNERENVRVVAQAASNKVKNLIKQTTRCDGSSPSLVREWMDEVSLSEALTGGGADTIDIATRTITGSLRKDVERYIAARAQEQPPVLSNAIQWAALKAHVTDAFLAPDERAYLRDEVEKIRQSPYEPVAGYNRRFRDAADAAFPDADRNEDQQRLLLKSYAKGLTDSDLARELVTHGRPVALEPAMTLVMQYARGKEEYKRLDRHEMPMEVDALRSRPQTPPSAAKDETAQQIKKLAATVNTLVTEIAKMKVTPPRRDLRQRPERQRRWQRNERQEDTAPPPQQKPRNSRQTSRPPIICYRCDRPGHCAQDCWTKLNTNRRQSNT